MLFHLAMGATALSSILSDLLYVIMSANEFLGLFAGNAGHTEKSRARYIRPQGLLRLERLPKGVISAFCSPDFSTPEQLCCDNHPSFTFFPIVKESAAN